MNTNFILFSQPTIHLISDLYFSLVTCSYLHFWLAGRMSLQVWRRRGWRWKGRRRL